MAWIPKEGLRVQGGLLSGWDGNQGLPKEASLQEEEPLGPWNLRLGSFTSHQTAGQHRPATGAGTGKPLTPPFHGALLGGTRERRAPPAEWGAGNGWPRSA